MVVFDARRPAGREAEFEAGADGAAPAGLILGRRHDRVTERGIDGETIAGHGAAALHVEQDAVPGPTDLAGEQSERIDLRGVGEARTREEQARGRSAEIGPVALS